jgi:hypothetical protein|tara:strand:- start:603 stop:935 length:333 start_codon:yes stop_codon:yes gene_type:complete
MNNTKYIWRHLTTMARPKPTIIVEYVDRNYNAEQILKADAVYAVYYHGKPINLRSLNTLIDYPGPKYKKSSFQNSGHAFNLADRLNILFKSELFTVVKLIEGEVITRGKI